jgi:chemotaxis protein methyltransferase CheR
MVERETAAPGALASAQNAPPSVTDIELGLLLEAVQRISGYDFRDYSPALMRRRIQERVRAEGVTTISGLQERILHEPGTIGRFIDAMTFSPSAPFREPEFFATFRERILPRLRTFPFVRIWVAGCGAGDDAYALSILLHEADFAKRARIYATDASEYAIERAKAAVVAADELETYEAVYAGAGGKRAFSHYIATNGNAHTYRPMLRDNIIFAQHNLATDGSFNEFHLVVARNILTQFNRSLAYRAHQVLYESIVRLGYLGLGEHETLRNTPHQRAYEGVEGSDVFHRRVR